MLPVIKINSGICYDQCIKLPTKSTSSSYRQLKTKGWFSLVHKHKPINPDAVRC